MDLRLLGLWRVRGPFERWAIVAVDTAGGFPSETRDLSATQVGDRETAR